MTWYKTAKKFTDLQQWMLHGVDPQACRDEFKQQKQTRAKIELEASLKAEKMGHVLFQNWSPLLTNRCRKCGMSIKINNVIDKTSAPNITGAVILNKCNVNLGIDNFRTSNEYLKDLNENRGSTII